MKNIVILGVLLFFTLSIKSQTVEIDTMGTVLVYKDSRIDILAKQELTQNQKTGHGIVSFGGLLRGYRVQVVNTNNRLLANKIKAELYTHFPSQKVYIVYRSPFFRVRIGNFKDRKDAENLMHVLTGMYSSGVYIVPDLIEYRSSAKDRNNDD